MACALCSLSACTSWRRSTLVDNGAWQEGDLAATVPLATDLAAGTHLLTLMVRSMNEIHTATF